MDAKVDTGTLGERTDFPGRSWRGIRPLLRGKWLGLAIVGLALAASVLWWSTRARVQVSYLTAAVTRGAVAPYVTASGSVNPVVTIQVGTYVSGVIQELHCDFNTQVKKGQLCAKIDPRPYQTIVDQDKANLATARAQLVKDKANLEYARTSDERARGLLALDSVSKDAADAARNAYEQAQAQVALDEAAIAQRAAELEAAQVNLDYTNIVSPVDGTVVSRAITQGQTVAASFQTPTLFLIATDLTRMQVDTNVSESDIGGVQLGNEATFTVEAFPNRPFHGRVSQVRQAPQTVQNVVTYDAVVDADNRQLLLMPGMTASVRITTQRHENVVRVPAQALRYTPASGESPRPAAAVPPSAATSHVWVLRAGAPVAVPIVTGLIDDTYAEIVQGEVEAGDQVITAERSASETAPRPPGQPIPRAPRL
jgi:HlyD family secretion protein